MSVQVGIVILNYNSFEDTIICIESILHQVKKYPFNIYVVDNQSIDQSVKVLSEKYFNYSNIYIINADRNGGYSYGNNIGINCALQDKCDYMVVVNPDIILLNDAVSICIDTLIDNSDVGIVGPLLTENSGLGQMVRKAITFKSFILNKSFFRSLTFFKGKELRNFDWDRKTDYKFDGIVAGCFMAVSSDFVKSIGGFDEDFFLYNEEDVLAYKLKKCGKKSMIAAAAKVFHAHAKTTRKSGMTFVYFHYRISEFLILRKYARINFWQKNLVYGMNIIWFLLYSIHNKEAKRYIKLLIHKYNMIYLGQYENINNYFL